MSLFGDHLPQHLWGVDLYIDAIQTSRRLANNGGALVCLQGAPRLVAET